MIAGGVKHSEVEKVDGSECGEDGHGLKGEDRKALAGSAAQPPDGEVEEDRELAGHEELPEMSRCSFVGFAGDSIDGDVGEDDGQGAKRHRNGNEGAGLTCDEADGGSHDPSLSRELAETRDYDRNSAEGF
jgi:hypothetical protein